MGHRELDLHSHGLELERHPRRLLAAEGLVELNVPAVGQAAAGLAYQHFAVIMDVAAVAEDDAASRRPVGFNRQAEPILARESAVGRRLPQPLRRDRDIGDVDEFRLAHFFASRPRLSSASALRRWRSYLPIQRSAISWIGTGLR